MAVKTLRNLVISTVLAVTTITTILRGASIRSIALYTGGSSDDEGSGPYWQPRNEDDGPATPRRRECTQRQLATIRTQLPPDECELYADRPKKMRCSFSYATRCPDPIWVEEHHAERIRRGEGRRSPFVGIFVGCNKGMDAVNAMRMGSGDPIFSTRRWREIMRNGTGNMDDDGGVCHQARASFEFELPGDDVTDDGDPTDVEDDESSRPRNQVFCIEPSPITYRALSRSAAHLGYDARGFVVTHAAVSRRDGTVRFPDYTKRVGKEQKSIADCAGDGPSTPLEDCVDVPAYSLDAYVSKYVPKGATIDHLSVDVEGYDQDVLLGGRSVLRRVKYLEFEYNWMGPWRNQTLSYLINVLDKDFGFTCYWPGIHNTTWRITGCWLDHYDLHFWSNVACVNRDIEGAADIARRMETTFDSTLRRGDDTVMSWENRKRMRQWRLRKEFVDPGGRAVETEGGVRLQGLRSTYDEQIRAEMEARGIEPPKDFQTLRMKEKKHILRKDEMNRLTAEGRGRDGLQAKDVQYIVPVSREMIALVATLETVGRDGLDTAGAMK